MRLMLRSRPPFTGVPRGPKHLKSTPRGTFRPGPLGTPVNGGRDRNVNEVLIREKQEISQSVKKRRIRSLS